MRKSLVAALVFAFLCVPAVRSMAQTLTPEERTFFDQHISKIVEIQPKRMVDPAVVKVFAVPFYDVAVTIHEAEGTSGTNVILTRTSSGLAFVGRPSGDEDLPDFPKMLNPAFRLATPADVQTMQQALDAVYPIVGLDSERKAATSRHVGDEWIFVRGTAFDTKVGFVFKTDAKGAITGVRFSVNIKD